MRLPLMLRDHAAPVVDAAMTAWDAYRQKRDAARRAITAPVPQTYDAYCQRLSNAWKQPATKTDAGETSQQAYERRQRDAWKR